MRRIIFVSCWSVLLLAGCTELSTVPAETVLQRAAQASASLESSRFTMDATVQSGFAGGRMNAVIVAKGVTQAKGSTVNIEAEANGTLTTDVTHAFAIEFETIADQNGDSYLLLKGFQVTPPHPLFPSDTLLPLLNQWWRIRSATQAPAATAITPDPRLLEAQAEVVRVVADKGIVPLQGRKAHHYDVTIDPEKLTAYLRRVAAENGEPFDADAVTAELARYKAMGELWIDAETYMLLAVRWVVEPAITDQSDAMHLMLHMNVTDHNTAPPVVIPTNAFDIPFGFGVGTLTGSAAVLPSGSMDNVQVDQNFLLPLPQ